MFYHPPLSTGQSAGSDASKAVVSTTDVDMLRNEVERLMMISEALWDMLKERHGYRDVDLIKRVAEIDMKDGQLDGRVQKTEPKACPHCRRKLTRRRMICLYCGKPVLPEVFAR